PRRPWAPPPAPGGLQHVDFDLLRLDLLGLRQTHGQDAVTVLGLDLVGLHRDRQRERALELSEPALAAVDAVLVNLPAPLPLALEGEHVAGDREVDVLLAE